MSRFIRDARAQVTQAQPVGPFSTFVLMTPWFLMRDAETPGVLQ